MKAFNNKLTNEILNNAGNIEDKEDKTLYVFAGPNGSGKSTLLANAYLEGKLQARYVNADLFCKTIFGDVRDVDKRNETSMYYTMDLVNRLIRDGKTFCYETVMSHPSKLEMIEMAKANGYKIVSVLVYTSDPEINVSRVETRAKQGGHDVPKDKIIARYYRTMKLAKELEKKSDIYFKFDNSKTLPIVEQIEDQIYID